MSELVMAELRTVLLCKLPEAKAEWATEQYFRVVSTRQLLAGPNETWHLTLSEDGVEDPNQDVAILTSVLKPGTDGEWEVRFYWREAVWAPASEERKRAIAGLSQLAAMMRSRI